MYKIKAGWGNTLPLERSTAIRHHILVVAMALLQSTALPTNLQCSWAKVLSENATRFHCWQFLQYVDSGVVTSQFRILQLSQVVLRKHFQLFHSRAGTWSH